MLEIGSVVRGPRQVKDRATLPLEQRNLRAGVLRQDDRLIDLARGASPRLGQAPVIDGLMKELGLDGTTLDGLVNAATQRMDVTPEEEKA